MGSEDSFIPYLQSLDFYKKLKAVLAENKAQFEILNGAGHGGPQFNDETNLEKIIAFFDKYLK